MALIPSFPIMEMKCFLKGSEYMNRMKELQGKSLQNIFLFIQKWQQKKHCWIRVEVGMFQLPNYKICEDNLN